MANLPPSEHERARHALVHSLRVQGHLSSPAIVDAMLEVPREQFIPVYLGHRAYEDAPLAIGLGQTISAPHMVAIMMENLDVGPGMNVLEVGTGSGYQAAVLSRLVGPKGRVVTVERIPQLAERAKQALRQTGHHNVEVHRGDGGMGFPMKAPYDRILVTAAAPQVPPPLLDQLTPTGLLLVPVGAETCDLVRVRGRASDYARESLGACAFVPLLGAHGHAGPVAGH